MVCLEGLEERSVSIWGKLDVVVRLEQDLTIRVKCWKHLLGEEHKVLLLASEESIVFEELHSLVVILPACHDKHRALEALRWNDWHSCAILELGRVRGKLMRVHLSLVEALGQDLEERLVAGKSNVKLAFRSIETKSASLSTGENHHAYLAISDELVPSRT